MVQREILTPPGMTANLMVIMTTTNSLSAKMADDHQGDGFYHHLKVSDCFLTINLYMLILFWEGFRLFHIS